MAEVKKTKTNNFVLYKINSSSQNDIDILLDIVKDKYNSFLKTIYPTEIFNYMFYFLDGDFLKDKIELDFHNYYLIKNNDNIVGYFDYRCFDDVLLICDLFILENYRNKGFSNLAFDFMDKAAKKQNLKRLWAFVCQKNESAKTLLEKWGFKKINTQANYAGSDIYLFEDVFEFVF